MTEEKVIDLLRDILNTIDENEYPEICSTILGNMDEECSELFMDGYCIAQQLHEADATKQFPKCVSDFIMKVYEEELEKGNADAGCNIGSLYYTGRAGEQNYAKAMDYYTLAADGGNRQAQENLGYCYYYGRDTAVDYEKAFHYFALGAFDGHIRSLYKIGDMYRKGLYVKKNVHEAFVIYMRCLDTMTDAALPLVGADVMMRVADCYFEGIGTDVDYMAALHYYQKAELLFYDRLQDGDFMIKGCYEKVISRQDQAREKMRELLPDYQWTNHSQMSVFLDMTYVHNIGTKKKR